MEIDSIKRLLMTSEGRKQMKEELRLFFRLVGNDLRSRYSGSAFGIIWAFVQPLVTILVFWFVYQVGFKNAPVANVEFILWFSAAFIPWLFFSDGIVTSSGVMYEYSFLVKKMRFNVWQLPLIKVFSALRIHMFFVFFLMGMFLLYGHRFQWTWLNIFFYSFYVLALLVGASFMVSSLTVFIKDAGQMVAVAMQVGFWLTPIFWSDKAMDPGILRVFKLNPMYYAVTGFRDALIYNECFWQRSALQTVYYWGFVVVCISTGISVYRLLREHFTDLL